ncbi:MAG TPA: PfkB family carbohydrate kinase, partial [Prolixibacteraceae bacterium]|nr:PfkB family carbohydrate kinase [Prolixibacteraceae bacterium]
VGAGDAFLAGLIDAMIEKRPPEESLARACAVGALVASREGATPGYLPAEIEQIKRNDERR